MNVVYEGVQKMKRRRVKTNKRMRSSLRGTKVININWLLTAAEQSKAVLVVGRR